MERPRRILGRVISLVAPLILGLAPAPSITKVAGGDFHVILRSDGAVYGVGKDDFGMHARANWAKSVVTEPLRMSLPSPAIDVAAGERTVYALLKDGTVIAWGTDRMGELGSGQENKEIDRMSLTPGPVAVLKDIVQIQATQGYAAALSKDGTVYTWGWRGPDLAGNGGVWDRKMNGIPQAVQGLTDVKAIDTGLNHMLALKKDGTVWAWGFNFAGQLGIGAYGDPVSKPTQVVGLKNVINISASDGGVAGSAAVTADGKVFAWGANTSCLLGNGKRPGSESEAGGRNPKPVLVAGASGAKQVSVGVGQVFVLHRNGTVSSWGFDGFGQLGQGKSADYTMHPKLLKLSGVTGVFTAGYRTFLTKSDGSLWWSGVKLPTNRGPMSKGSKVFVKAELKEG